MEYILLIKKIRILRKMSQKELSEKSGVHQTYISQLERNDVDAKSPTLKIIFRIAQALEVCPHFLIKYTYDCPMNCVHKCGHNFLTV